MTRNTILAVAVTAASAMALSGCLDDGDPLGPLEQCELSSAPLADVAGDTVTVEPGLLAIEREVGSDDTAQNGDIVDVCYVARFTGGEAFDAGPLLTVTLGLQQLIPGFERGVVGIGVGGIRRLIVPPELAYGSEPVRNPQTGEIVIPANSTLVFDVQVLRIR